MEFLKDFAKFLEQYKIMGLAIAFVVGTAANTFVKALVDDIIMPLITPFIPYGAWKTATFTFGSVVISWGDFLGALINFLIIAVAIFVLVYVLPKDIEKGKEFLLKQAHNKGRNKRNK
jgi:large conductance mechanosensitive channel